jgi:hypothetical protein
MIGLMESMQFPAFNAGHEFRRPAAKGFSRIIYAHQKHVDLTEQCQYQPGI